MKREFFDIREGVACIKCEYGLSLEKRVGSLLDVANYMKELSKRPKLVHLFLRDKAAGLMLFWIKEGKPIDLFKRQWEPLTEEFRQM